MSIDISKIWSGLDDAQRKQKWTERIDKKLLDWKLTLSSLNPAVKDEIDLQLQPGFFTNFTPPLSAEDNEDVRSVLRMDAAFNHRTRYVDGYAQLAARLLQHLSHDTRLAFATLQSLNSQLKPFQSDASRCRNDALTLSAQLCRDLPELCAFLNSVGFDVVDLADMTALYVPCAYAIGFAGDVVGRCVDVLLLDPLGASFLFSVMYGVLRVNAKTIVTQSADNVFQFIADLPGTMTRSQAGDAFAHAYKAVRSKSELINADRKKRSWSQTVTTPGSITFTTDVGDPTVRTTPPSIVTSGASSAAVSRVTSGAATPSASFSPSQANATPDFSVVTFNLRDLSNDKPTAPPSVLDRLSAADRETDVNKLRDLIRLAQTHIKQLSSAPAPSSSGSSLPRSLPAASPALKTPPGAYIKHVDLHEYQSYPCMVMEGFLLKSRQANKFLNRQKKTAGASSTLSAGLFGVQLHRRLFVLEGDWLVYYKVRGDKRPARDEALWVRCCWIEELSEKEFGQWGFGFEVRIRVKTQQQPADSKATPKGSAPSGGGGVAPASEPLFVLFASTSRERQQWVQLLKRASGQE